MRKFPDRTFQYSKVEIPVKSLSVVDLRFDKMDGQIAACVLQGIVNRQSSDKIYVINTYCHDNKGGGANQAHVSERYLTELYQDIPTKYQNAGNDVERPGFSGMVRRYRDYIKGLIIWDPGLEQATIEAATTIAGQTDGLVVSPEIAEELSTKYPVIIDMRKLQFKDNIQCLDWLLSHWMSGANRDFAFTWSHMTLDEKSWGAANKDYVVANCLFSFYLDITDEEEKEYYGNVLDRYAPGTPILGWTDERWADALFMKLGYFMVPYISVENMTVHSSFPSTGGTYPEPKPAQLHENGVYISFFIADGDNLLHSMVYEPDTIMTTQRTGAIPISWVVNPGLIDLAPRLFDWYKQQIPGDELVAMVSDGHPSSDRFSAFEYYCDFTAGYMRRAGIVTMKQMEESEAIAWRIQPYMINSGYAGICPKGIGPYEYHMDGETFHIGSVKLNDSAESIRKYVKNAPEEGPLFLNVFAGTAVKDIPLIVENVAAELKAGEKDENRHYFFLRSMDLAATYRKWNRLK
ncbi:MAG: hypothetical protein J7L22_07820 [Candidatus Marinimicrobia bacterium]|nr:hypothetical protein [Candidatus Neomarinimicrobiota bacterium]